MTTPFRPKQLADTRWDPSQYRRFADQRLRPALELLARVTLPNPNLVYDLGCGSGEATRILAERWPQATVHGLDNSSEMLAKAAGEPSRVHWTLADIHSWQPETTPDLIYSNATLHWLENHTGLFPRLLGFLKPGGWLAVQMPFSWGLPSHRIIRETLANGGLGGAPLGTEQLRLTVARDWVQDAATYFDLLAPKTQGLDIWETEYLHVLEGTDPVLEWVKGTGLRPVLHGLDDSERAIFLNEYAARLRIAYPKRPDGRTVYPFRRLFIVATV